MSFLVAIALGLIAFLLGAVVKRRIETGSIIASPNSGMSSGRTTREKHPIFFWIWNIQLIGATLFVAAAAIFAFLDAIELVQIANALESQNIPNP